MNLAATAFVTEFADEIFAPGIEYESGEVTVTTFADVLEETHLNQDAPGFRDFWHGLQGWAEAVDFEVHLPLDTFKADTLTHGTYLVSAFETFRSQVEASISSALSTVTGTEEAAE